MIPMSVRRLSGSPRRRSSAQSATPRPNFKFNLLAMDEGLESPKIGNKRKEKGPMSGLIQREDYPADSSLQEHASMLEHAVERGAILLTDRVALLRHKFQTQPESFQASTPFKANPRWDLLLELVGLISTASYVIKRLLSLLQPQVHKAPLKPLAPTDADGALAELALFVNKIQTEGRMLVAFLQKYHVAYDRSCGMHDQMAGLNGEGAAVEQDDEARPTMSPPGTYVTRQGVLLSSDKALPIGSLANRGRTALQLVGQVVNLEQLTMLVGQFEDAIIVLSALMRSFTAGFSMKAATTAVMAGLRLRSRIKSRLSRKSSSAPSTAADGETPQDVDG